MSSLLRNASQVNICKVSVHYLASRNILLLSFLSKRCLSAATSSTQSKAQSDKVELLGKVYDADHMTSVTPNIISHVGRNLHQVPKHPVNIIKQRIVHHFHKSYTNRVGNAVFAHFDDVSPVVSCEQNFDSLLVSPDHVTRSKKDNYYINSDTLLRAHTSAHQRDFIRMGFDQFLVSGDVYRRDAIDSSHYPVFHQMEGVRLFTAGELFKKECSSHSGLKLFESQPDSERDTSEKQSMHTMDAVKMMEINLKETLNKLMQSLFGNEIETRWNPCYFPFTHPSYELEIKFKGEWLEVLGSGVMRQPILEKGGAYDKVGWAFGLGLDRLAMLLFDIQDIRLFWSKDVRFLKQFEKVDLNRESNIKYNPFSVYPSSHRDISFWLPNQDFSENDFYEIVRFAGGDLVEEVKLVDQFTHLESQRLSNCYRITYRAMDRTFTNEEVNEVQNKVRALVQESLGVELR